MGAPTRLRSIELSGGRLPETAADWLRSLGGPTLLRVPGRDPTRRRAVTTLLHGNEPSGTYAVHAWLRGGAKPAVDTLIFLGAVEAALHEPMFSNRFLAGARDLNRCFRPPFSGPEGELAREILQALEAAAPEALVDVHNNTGHNPPYGVGPRAGDRELDLVGLFGRRYVHSDLRLGAIIEATQDHFPSVTVECGRAGDPAADAVALAGLERFLGSERLGGERLEGAPFELLTDPVRVCVAPGTRLSFGDGVDPRADLTVSADVDRHNFESLPVGTPMGWVAGDGPWPLQALDAEGRELSRELFVKRDGRLETRRPIVPIMMTTNPGVALADCLFYVVRRAPSASEPPAP